MSQWHDNDSVAMVTSSHCLWIKKHQNKVQNINENCSS